MSDFAKLSDLLQKPLKKHNLAHVVEMDQKCRALQDEIAKQIPAAAGKIKVISLRNRTFKISAPSALAQKISFQKVTLLQELQLDEQYQFQFVSES